MREEPMDPNEYLLQEIWINRKAAERAIHEHRYMKALCDPAFQRFLMRLTLPKWPQ